MNKLFLMVGLPGSGKSHQAKLLSKKERAVIISTDEIRFELFGDETIQKNTNHVFYEVYTRMEKAFEEGKNVILDATNIEREKRMNVLNKFPNVIKKAVYMDTPYHICLKRNKERRRSLEEKIMNKYRMKLEIPYVSEGFDEILIIHESFDYGITKEKFVELLKKKPTYKELFDKLRHISFFNEMINFNQENPYHSFTLCYHTYHALEYINEFYEEDDLFLLQVVALFHDIGKLYTKKFKPLKNHYSYWGHELVSSHIVHHFLYELGFDEKFIHDATGIIEMHMKIAREDGENEIYHTLGPILLTKLYSFHKADVWAK